jgi:hypothetical protein
VVCGRSVLGLGKSVGVHSRDGLAARWIVAAYEAAGKGLEKGPKAARVERISLRLTLRRHE